MGLNALTIDYKNRVKEHWDRYKLTISSDTTYIDDFLRMMYSDDTSQHLGLFFKTMKERDVIRNENMFETFPELIDLKEQYDKRY
jgi:hypothetical protein